MAKVVFVLIDTQDMDALDVEVFTNPKVLADYLSDQLVTSFGDQASKLSDDEQRPITSVLATWRGECDLNVWGHEGRVIFSVKMKDIRA